MTRVFRRPFLWLDDLRASAEKGTTIAALDGVRGFAALIVLASHTSFLGMTGQGSIGVWVFFTLSGFLLSQPFLAQPEPSIDRYARFMFRRARRILPAYWVTVLLLYAPSTGFNWSETWSNLVMLKAWGHLWSVKQELVLYCLLPLLLALAPSTS